MSEVVFEHGQFQKVMNVLESIEENTRPKLDPKPGPSISRDLFFAKLATKTDWGRNELKRVFDECVSESKWR